MKIVYRAENAFDAHLVQDALAEAQLPAYISGEQLSGAAGPIFDMIAVWVDEDCFPEAEIIARRVAASLAVASDEASELPEDWAPEPA